MLQDPDITITPDVTPPVPVVESAPQPVQDTPESAPSEPVAATPTAEDAVTATADAPAKAKTIERPKEKVEVAEDAEEIADTLVTTSTMPVTDLSEPVETVVTEPPAYLSGLEPIARHESPARDSGLIAVLLGLLLLLSFNAGHFRRVLRSFGRELWSLRRRASLFDEQTSNENRLVVVLLLTWCVMMAIVGYGAFQWLSPEPLPPLSLPVVGMLGGVVAGYYLFQLMAYTTVGLTFADGVRTRQWLQGLNASTSLLALGLILPALGLIFYPQYSEWLILAAAAMYAVARIMFISKGFRIFYHNFPSLLYFILYLCTLEFVPPYLVYKIASEMLR